MVITAGGNQDIVDVQNHELSIYPNPASATLNVVVAESGEASVLDAMGRTVMCQSVMAGGNAIDVSMLPNGLYFVRIGINYSTFIIKH